MAVVMAVRDTSAIAKRNLLRTVRTPQLLLIGALQPAMLLVLFRYVLGGAIQVGGGYVNYLVPAVFVEAVLIGGMATAIGLAQDINSGIIDRFRSLPMARSAVLAGRSLADLSRSAISLGLMVGLGVLLGFQFHGSVVADFGAIALVLLFGYAFSWVYSTIGLITKNPETAQVIGVLPFFLLVFASTAIVPLATLPTWMQPFARDQPVSVTIDAVRALTSGDQVHSLVWGTIAWSAGIFVMFFTIAVDIYRSNSS